MLLLNLANSFSFILKILKLLDESQFDFLNHQKSLTHTAFERLYKKLLASSEHFNVNSPKLH